MDHWGFKMQGLKAKEPQELCALRERGKDGKVRASLKSLILLAKLEDRRLFVKIEKHLILWSSPKD